MKLDRRSFFQVSALGGAAAGLGACSGIVPQTPKRRHVGPEKLVTTACGACPSGCGVVVRVVGKNAVHVEGVEGHPVNDGGMCPRGIAEVQNLYHHERLQAPLVKGAKASWDDAIAAVAGGLKGAGSVVIGVGSAARADAPAIDALASALKAKVVLVELPNLQYPLDAMRELLGTDDFQYDLANADAVLSLGMDWLQELPSPVQTQRAFAAIRSGEDHGFIATASSRLSTTAGRSNLWIPVRPTQMALFGKAIYQQIESGSGVALAEELGVDPDLITRTAQELKSHKRPVVITDRSDPDVQRVGVALNQLLGAVGREGGLVRAAAMPGPAAAGSRWLDRFPADVQKPAVLLIDANPVYLARGAMGWTDGLAGASYVASISCFADESGLRADAVLPPSTPLETKVLRWGSTFGGKGFASAGPAAVAKLYDTLDRSEILIRLGKSAGAALPWANTDEYIAALAGPLAAGELFGSGGHVEVDPNAAAAPPAEGEAPAEGAAPEPPPAEPPPPNPTPPDPTPPKPAALPAIQAAAAPPQGFPLELDVHSPLAFRGGEGAHLPYLHGLANGIEREVWRTIVEINPEPAHERGIENGDLVWVESAQGKLQAVARVREGIRPDSVAMAVGLGRAALGIFAEGHGANPLNLVGETGPVFVQVRRAS